MWDHRGQTRPDFARVPDPGQESVWDYPRPPRLVPDDRLVEVWAGEHLIARTRSALRVLETASPPTVYLPRADTAMDLLEEAVHKGLMQKAWIEHDSNLDRLRERPRFQELLRWLDENLVTGD